MFTDVTLAALAVAMWMTTVAVEELIEIPMLALIAAIVFEMARSRTRLLQEKLAANEELTFTTERYKALMAAVPAVIYTAEIGPDGTWLVASEGARDVLA